MDWKTIVITVLVLGVGYLIGNLLPFSPAKVIREPYIVTEKEYHFRDTTIINNFYKTIINEKYKTDTAYINNAPDSLLWGIIMSRSRFLLEQN